jgi:hypothetical protein
MYAHIALLAQRIVSKNPDVHSTTCDPPTPARFDVPLALYDPDINLTSRYSIAIVPPLDGEN